MSRSNSFLDLAQRSRIYLMKETGLDDLDYNLAILHGGMAYLDAVVQPGKSCTPELVPIYKEHLTNLGYWQFYVFLFRHMEIGIAESWSKAGAIEAYQSTEWKRERFLEEVTGLPFKREANYQFEAWLKELGPQRTLTIQPQQHEHADSK